MSAVLASDGEFRPMKDNDLMAIMEVERRAYPFPWTLGIFRDCLRVGYNCWVWERNSCIEAYGVISIGAGECHILNLCVRPESRGQGLGRLLLEHLIEQARARKVETMLLEVRPSNTAALALYQRLGFNEMGLRKNYYPAEKGREDALILGRVL